MPRLAPCTALIVGASIALGLSDRVHPLSAQVPSPPPGESGSPVHIVRLDAVVVDARGEAVDNLTDADLSLREDGVARPVDSVRFNPTSRRIVGIYLDEYHVTPGAAAERARSALTRFVDSALGPTDLVAVMKPLDSLYTIRPTLDRGALHEAISSFVGRKGDYAPENAYERSLMATDPVRAEAARLQVSISALEALAVALGRVDDGRKTLVVVAEGLGRPERTRGREYLATLESVIRSSNRLAVSIYAVDPGDGVMEASEGPGREALRTAALQTDGGQFRGDLDAAFRRIARDARDFYLVSYRAPHREDGAFHPVELKAVAPGLEVHARAGYWAPSPDDRLRASILARAAQPTVTRLEPFPHASSLIRPWFGLSRGEAGKTRVTFVWEPAPGVPGDRVRRRPSRVSLKALGEDDAVIYEGVVQPTGPSLAGGLVSGTARADFEVPPGKARLRMTIEDDAARTMDSDVRDLAMRDWRVAVAIATPEVLRARNARELRALDADPDAVPVASREFSRTERLRIRVRAYSSSGAPPMVTARLVGRPGNAIRELKVVPPSAPDGYHQIDLPLAGLAPGGYAIDIAAAAPEGSDRERLEFRVTN